MNDFELKYDEPIWTNELIKALKDLVRERGENMPLVFRVSSEDKSQDLRLMDVKRIGDEVYLMLK